MKSQWLKRQILIAVLIIALFSIGMVSVLFVLKDSKAEVLNAYDFEGMTAVIYSPDRKSTGADCPVYSMGNDTYLALFDGACRLSEGGLFGETAFIRNGSKCEIKGADIKTCPVESAPEDKETYEFFGGEISFYSLENGKVAVIFLMNHAGGAAYERVEFGKMDMTSKEYHDARGGLEDGMTWNEDKKVYVNEFGEEFDRRTAPEYEIPVLRRAANEDAYVSFYLTDAQYEAIMQEKIFALRGAEGGVMSALFWEKE